MNKKHKIFAWLSGIVLIMIVGLSSTMLASKSLLSAKEERANNIVEESGYIPSAPPEKLRVERGGRWHEFSASELNLSTKDFDLVRKIAYSDFIIERGGSIDKEFDNYFCIDYDAGLYIYGDYQNVAEDDFYGVRSSDASRARFKMYRPEITWLLDNFYYGDNFEPDFDTVRNRQIVTQIAIWNYTNPETTSIKNAIAGIPQVQKLIDESRAHRVIKNDIYDNLVNAEYEMYSEQTSLQKDGEGYVALIDINATPDLTSYFIEDKLSPITVTVGGVQIEESLETFSIKKQGDSIEVRFESSFYNNIGKDTEIVVSSERTIVAQEPTPFVYDYNSYQPIVTSRRKELKTVIPTEVRFVKESIDYSLEIQKEDEKGNTLTGADFQLKATDGSMNQTLTVGGDGKVKFEELLPEVTYTLTETKAPEGYQKKEESYTIVMDTNGKLTVKEGTKTLVAGQDYTWDENNLVLSFQVENTALLGDVELIKTDSRDGHTLAGAEFTLYKGKSTNRGEEVGKYTTDSSGKIKVEGLPYGDYHFVETKAPQGYQLDPTPIDFTVNDSVTTVSLSKKNTTGKEITLTKTDEETGLPLEGAVFVIQPRVSAPSVPSNPGYWLGNYTLTGVTRREFVTDSNGQIIINNQTYPGVIDQLINDIGKDMGGGMEITGYRFREKEAPAGYPDPGYTMVSENVGQGDDFSVVINMNDLRDPSMEKQDLTYFMTNTMNELFGNVELEKFDVQNPDTKLPGAKFDLYREGEATPIQTDLTTNSSGKLTVSGLPLGDYYFVETQAPNGYDPPESDIHYEFSITKENSLAQIKATVPVPNVKENVPVGSVRLFKHDSTNTGLGLPDAEFSLYQKNGTEIRKELTTDKAGVLVVSDLPVGEYYFVETKAPNGYFLPNGKIEFEITTDSVEQELAIPVEVANVKTPPRELTLTKTDEETGEPIPGVVFIIQNRNTFFNEWGPVDTGVNKQPLVTDENGQIIINDTTYPGLIDHMIELNEKPDVSGMRFREISTPEGWVDPYPTKSGQKDSVNDLSANDFAKDIPMETLKGLPLSDETIHVELTMKNKKEQNDSTIIQVEKRDKTTGNLITDGEATFIIQSLRDDNQWSAFNEQQFTTKNGVAVIEDEALINDLLRYQGGNNDQKYRFREIEAPEGYKDPHAPSPLNAREPQGGIGDEFSKEFTLDKEKPSTVTVVIENEKPDDPVDRTLSLKKIDEDTNEPLSGAEFIIEKYDASSQTWKKVNSKTYTTDRNGMIELDEDDIQSFGTDYPITIAFRETKAPDGYELPGNGYSEEITITANSVSPDTITMTNREINVDQNLTLKKVDGTTNLPLSGALFQLYKEDSNGIFQLYDNRFYSTNDDGEYEFSEYELSRLEPGNYKMKEIFAPDDYMLPDDPFTEVFTISNTSVTPDQLVKKNYKEPIFTLKKVDQNGQPVEGAEFDLYRLTGLPAFPEMHISYYTTDENGEIVIGQNRLKELENGEYFFRETKAPPGYEILKEDTESFIISNGEANPNVIRHVNQYTGSTLEFHKVDERGAKGEGLNGAVFKLEQETSRNNWEVVKDKNGKDVEFTTGVSYDEDGDIEYAGTIYLTSQDIKKYDLANGTYRFKETRAPDGYELPEDPYTDTFEITNGVAFNPELIYKDNSRLRDRELTLKKVDGRDQNKGLAGAEFILETTRGIFLGNNNNQWTAYPNQWNPEIFVTDENGEIILDDDELLGIFGIGDGEKQKGRFKEVKAPNGYLLPDDVYTEEFEIQASKIVDKNGRPITELKKINYRAIQNYELELLKVNDNEVRLDGAEFTLVPTKGSGQPQVSTGDKGIFTFKDLEPDVEYTLTETKAPDDYFINKTPYTFILRTDEDPDGILEVYYNGKLLEEGKDYEWDNTELKLSLVMINRKSSMPITGSIGILSLLIAGATAIGIAYNFQLKKKKSV